MGVDLKYISGNQFEIHVEFDSLYAYEQYIGNNKFTFLGFSNSNTTDYGPDISVAGVTLPIAMHENRKPIFSVISEEQLLEIEAKLGITDEFIKNVLINIDEYFPDYNKTELEKHTLEVRQLLAERMLELWIDIKAKYLTNHCIESITELISNSMT